MRLSPKQVLYGILGVSVALNIASWVVVYFLIPAANVPFIIRYRMSGTGDVFGDRAMLFMGSLTGLIILLVNGMMGYLVFEKERRFAFIILGITVAYQVLALVYSFILIRVNTY